MASKYVEIPYGECEPGDVIKFEEDGERIVVVEKSPERSRLRFETSGERAGRIKYERRVHVRTLFKDQVTPAGDRLDDSDDPAIRELLERELGATQVFPEKMTPGEWSMHLELFHGIYARDYPAGMTPRERGASLRETHAADHEGMTQQGVKPPQITHEHDQSAWTKKEQRWLSRSR